MTLLLLLACSGDPPAVDTAAPSGWTWVDSGDTAQLAAAEVQPLLADALPVLRGLDPASPFRSYAEAFDHADASCPRTWTTGTQLAWEEDCTTATGWRFDGRAQVFWQESRSSDLRAEGELAVAAEITGPEGSRWRGSGDASMRDVSEERAFAEGEAPRTVRRVEGVAVGSWAWTEGDADWLREGGSLSMVVESEADAVDRRWLRLDGGVSRYGTASAQSGVREDEVVVTAELLVFHSLETGTGCALEPGGSLRLRTADGVTARVRFDGAQALGDTVDPADCDGCGRLEGSDEVVCLDFSAFLDWEQSPW